MQSSPSRQPSLKRAAPSPPPSQPLTPPLTPAYTLPKKDAKRSTRMDRGSRFLAPPSPSRHVLYSTFASRSDNSSMASQLSATGSTEHSEQESFTTDHRTSESSVPLKDREITEGGTSQPPTRFLFVGNVPNDVTGSALTDEFASLGEVRGAFVRLQARLGVIILTFYDIRHAIHAHDCFRSGTTFFDGRRLHSRFISMTELYKLVRLSSFTTEASGEVVVSVADPTTNLPALQAFQASVHRTMETHGEVRALQPVGPREFLIEFFDSRHAAAAIQTFHNRNISGIRVHVESAESPVSVWPVTTATQDGGDHSLSQEPPSVQSVACANSNSNRPLHGDGPPGLPISRAVMFPERSTPSPPTWGRRSSTGSASFIPGELTPLQLSHKTKNFGHVSSSPFENDDDDLEEGELRVSGEGGSSRRTLASIPLDPSARSENETALSIEVAPFSRRTLPRTAPSTPRHRRITLPAYQGPLPEPLSPTSSLAPGPRAQSPQPEPSPTAPTRSHSPSSSESSSPYATPYPPAQIYYPPHVHGHVQVRHAQYIDTNHQIANTGAGASMPPPRFQSWSPVSPGHLHHSIPLPHPHHASHPHSHAPRHSPPHTLLDAPVAEQYQFQMNLYRLQQLQQQPLQLQQQQHHQQRVEPSHQDTHLQSTSPQFQKRPELILHHRPLQPRKPGGATRLVHAGRSPIQQQPSHAFLPASARSVLDVVRDPPPERNKVDPLKIEQGLDTRTTVMLKNVPNKMTAADLMDFIGEVCPLALDFLYLRIDFVNKCNVGYAFVNFIDIQDLLKFCQERLGKKWNLFQSEKVLQMSYANYQGKAALVDKFRNSAVLDQKEAWRPKLFHSEGPKKGLPHAFPPPNSAMRHERSSHSRLTHGMFTHPPHEYRAAA